MLELRNLNKVYTLDKEKVHAVKDVNLKFERGEFVSILGLSGSGKTTLVSMIGGLEEPSSGQLLIDGIDTSTYKSKQWTDYRKNSIGFVFQDFNLIQHLTAIDNIKLALSLSGNSEEDKEIRAKELLELVHMSEQSHQFPSELSGGQQQRIAIARALANNPEVILADEPSGALDPDTAAQIMNLLQELAKKNHLVIMVTHDKYLARDYSTRIVEIAAGDIIRDTKPNDHKSSEEEVTKMAKSSLEFKAAFKLAFNNLRVRKKSSLMAIFALVPSIIIVMLFGNFIINVMSYQEDISPIYNKIVNDPKISYIADKSEGAYDMDIKSTLKSLFGGRYEAFKVDKMEAELYEPFSAETIAEIESLEHVDAVIEPNYFNLNINGQPFILVGLLPEAYKQYQYDFDFDYYPRDFERGLIMSEEAASYLNKNDPYKLAGQSVDINITSYNGLPLHIGTYMLDENILTVPILKVVDPGVKTVLMSSYYKGYIFASYDYINEIKANFDVDDISLVAFKLAGVLSQDATDNQFIMDGPQNLSDILDPLRSRTRFGKDLDIFTFKEYAVETPSSNFTNRHMIIANQPLTEDDLTQLVKYGPYYRSAFDEFAVDSAIDTNSFIEKILLYTKIVVGVVVTLPSVLVTLILYISILLRTKEIGVLKSIGAKNKDIVAIFTIESGILAFASGLIATVISFPVLAYARGIVENEYNVSYHLGSNPLDTNLLAILSSLFAIVTLTTLLGLLPGRKASKLHPRELLRSIN